MWPSLLVFYILLLLMVVKLLKDDLLLRAGQLRYINNISEDRKTKDTQARKAVKRSLQSN